MTSEHNTCKSSYSLAVLIFILTSALYTPTLLNGFVYDDNFVVMENMLIRGATPILDYFLNNVWSFFSEDSKANFYRPLQLLLYRLEYALFGLTPWPWHLVNLLLHAANATFVYLLALQVLPIMKKRVDASERMASSVTSSSSLYPALLAAAIFALQPVNVEPVAWISSVSDLLFTFFFLLGFLFYIKSKGQTRPSLNYFTAALILFALALFSKETAMAFIPVVFIYDVFFREVNLRAAIRSLIPFIIVAVLYLIIRTVALGGITQKEVTELSAGVAIINIFPLFFSYISKLLVPMNLSVIYEVDLITSVLSLKMLAGVLLLSLFIFLFCYFRKTKTIPLALILIFIPLLPILYIPAVSTGGFAERYLYLPSVGLALFLAYWLIWGIAEVHKRHYERDALTLRLLKLLVLVPVVATLLLYFFSSTARMREWKDDLTLWNMALNVSPKSAIAHYNLGTFYDKENKYGLAMWHYQNAGRLDPAYSLAFFNIGSLMGRSGRFDGAIHYFKKAIEIDPGVDIYHLSLARAYLGGAKMDLAKEVLEMLLEREPDMEEARELLKDAKSQR